MDVLFKKRRIYSQLADVVVHFQITVKGEKYVWYMK